MKIHLALLLALLMLSSHSSSAEYIHQKDKQFKYALSSGAFSIHKKAHSVDWLLVNNSSKPRKYRVTIYEVSSRGRKVIAPGSLAGTLEPGASTHNANDIGKDQPFQKGRKYKIVVEVNTRKVSPKAEMWSGSYASTVIPKTVIESKQFKKIK